MSLVWQSSLWWLAIIVCFSAVFTTLWLAKKASVVEKVAQRLEQNKQQSFSESSTALLKNTLASSWFARIGLVWQRDLVQAGFFNPNSWKVYGLSKFGLAIVGCIVAAVIWKIDNIWLIAGSAFSANLLPDMWLSYRQKVQRKAIIKALPDHISLLVVCLRAGLSIDRALMLVATELSQLSGALCHQWKITLEQLAMNPDRQHVWQALDERVNIESFSAFVELLQQSERYGSAIGDTLTNFHEQLRESEQLVIEEKIGKVASYITLPMLLLIFLPLMVIMLAPQLALLIDALQAIQ